MREALLLTLLSILLEIFGQIFISITTTVGYFVYFMSPKLIVVMFCLTWQADNGGLFIGNTYGTGPFAVSLSPKKTNEGIIGAILLCFISAVLMHIFTNYLG